ncbi:hypothetical protein [Thermomonospora catenispora]|uniref:hypothetical protein n=1 Tax=Thermomonospora catenispora TaxID=2493090 RepID=UPI00158E999C|nr:hypothetical protein [Thermomonospora catenispora]
MTISPDEERPVDLVDDELEILPDQTSDDTESRWGEWRDDDSRLLEERPPHW